MVAILKVRRLTNLKNDFLLFDSCIVTVFVHKTGDFSRFHSIVYIHPPPLFTSRLHLDYWSTLKVANDPPILASYYAL